MTSEELQRILKDRSVLFTEKSVQHGTSFNCKSGEIFNVFDSGKMSFQGKQGTALANDIRALYDGTPAAPAARSIPEVQVTVTQLPRQSRPSLPFLSSMVTTSIHAISLSLSFTGCDWSPSFWAT
jgi:hypothetical protein